MRRAFLALLGATTLTALSTAVPAQAQSGVNAGSLQCNVSGGVGFIFGSSKDMSCLLVRTDGSAERYVGSINKYGVDIGFTKEASIVWLVFAPGAIAKGALAGDYGGATAGASVGIGAGANVLIGGSNKQISLQPVSVEGTVGLNVAAGIASVTLRPAH
jgi:hypothetical protein